MRGGHSLGDSYHDRYSVFKLDEIPCDYDTIFAFSLARVWHINHDHKKERMRDDLRRKDDFADIYGFFSRIRLFFTSKSSRND